MRKKGFTLIEIIVCIAIIGIIGVGSFIGIRIVDNKILKDKLNQITNEAIEAAQVYLETNEKASNQLYEQKNGVSLPLKLLVKEGLLDISNTKLKDDDLENQYVVTFLGGTGSNGSDNCEQITSTTSWGNDKEIYLCMNSSGGGGSNLAIIDPSKTTNKTKASNSPFYFRGSELGSRNFVKYNEKIYRIYYIDTDDSLVLYSDDSFGNTFNGKTQPVSSYNLRNINSYSKSGLVFCNGVDNKPKIGNITSYYSYDGEARITSYDVIMTSLCTKSDGVISDLDGWMTYYWEYYGNSSSNGYYIEINNKKGYKIHLQSSIKIISGTGDYANPYIIQ